VKPSWIVTIAGVAALAWLARGLALPVFLAMAFAYLLSPVVAWADALAIRRSVAVGALFSVIIAVLLAAGLLLGPRMVTEASLLVDRLPALASQIDTGLDGAVRELIEAAPLFRRVLPEGGGWVHRFVLDRFALDRPSQDPSDLFEHAGHLFLLAILVPFFAFFLLRDMPRIVTAAMDRLPPQHVETSVAVWRELNGVIGRYIRGVVLDGLVVGVLAALGLWALRVPYPLLLGAFAGVANMVPFIGPLLSAAAAGLVVLLTPGQGLAGVVRVAVLFLAIKVLDDTIIQPFTIGRSVHLHPALLLGSVVVGNHALGVLGMIVAVPAATVLQETVRLLLEHRRVLARRSLRSHAGRLGG
jgi:predicted PurR-regulated permease PerM